MGWLQLWHCQHAATLCSCHSWLPLYCILEINVIAVFCILTFQLPATRLYLGTVNDRTQYDARMLHMKSFVRILSDFGMLVHDWQMCPSCCVAIILPACLKVLLCQINDMFW